MTETDKRTEKYKEGANNSVNGLMIVERFLAHYRAPGIFLATEKDTTSVFLSFVLFKEREREK